MNEPVTVDEATALLREILNYRSAFERGTVYITRAHADADVEIRSRIRSLLERCDETDETAETAETTEVTFQGMNR